MASTGTELQGFIWLSVSFKVYLNGLVLAPTEWIVVVDERGRGFAEAGAERHTLEKWFSLPQRCRNIKVRNDSYHRAHGTACSPGRERKGGRGANRSSILVANVMSNDTRAMAQSLLCFIAQSQPLQ